MKAFTVPLQPNRQFQMTAGQKYLPALSGYLREIMAMMGAVAVAVAIVILSIGVTGTELNNILAAATWGVAFLFLGLAVDNREPAALLQLITGVVLLALAWLQNNVSSDYMVVSGVVVAIWVAVTVFRWLR
jgi:hypothetical protein